MPIDIAAHFGHHLNEVRLALYSWDLNKSKAVGNLQSLQGKQNVADLVDQLINIQNRDHATK